MKIDKKAVNALTVDVEDYYQVEAFTDVISREDWGRRESRVERNIDRLLDLFARHNVRSTFFILGWIAEKHPQMVYSIARAGHEIASHGYHHCLISKQKRDEFRDDIRRSKDVLEEIVGKRVYGYRAPTYSITAKTIWALDVLIEEGYTYDSSIFPVYHDRYGIPGANRFPHLISGSAGRIMEFPPSTVRVAGQNVPMAGGGYFRLMPYPVFRWGINRINKKDGQPAMFMIHAWEIDPGQPVIAGSRLNVWRHYNNLDQTASRLERLLSDFRFAPASEVLQVSKESVLSYGSEPIASDPVYARMD